MDEWSISGATEDKPWFQTVSGDYSQVLGYGTRGEEVEKAGGGFYIFTQAQHHYIH